MIYEFFGMPAAGKTTYAKSLIEECSGNSSIQGVPVEQVGQWRSFKIFLMGLMRVAGWPAVRCVCKLIWCNNLACILKILNIIHKSELIRHLNVESYPNVVFDQLCIQDTWSILFRTNWDVGSLSWLFEHYLTSIGGIQIRLVYIDCSPEVLYRQYVGRENHKDALSKFNNDDLMSEMRRGINIFNNITAKLSENDIQFDTLTRR